MEDKKKVFIVPAAEIINFVKDDVIATSSGWGQDDNGELFKEGEE